MCFPIMVFSYGYLMMIDSRQCFSKQEKKRRLLALQKPFPAFFHPDRERLFEAYLFLRRSDFSDPDEQISFFYFLFLLFTFGTAEGFSRILTKKQLSRFSHMRFFSSWKKTIAFFRRKGGDIFDRSDGSVLFVFRRSVYRGISLFIEKLSVLPFSFQERFLLFLRADFSVFLPEPVISSDFCAGFRYEVAARYSSLCSFFEERGVLGRLSETDIFSVTCDFFKGRRKIFSLFSSCGDVFWAEFCLNEKETALVYRKISSLSPSTAELFLHPENCTCPHCRKMYRQTVYRYRVWNAPYPNRQFRLKISSDEILKDCFHIGEIKIGG